VRVTRDGSVELLSGVQDIGGGIRTALAQVVAQELGLKPSDVTIKIGDTSFPQGPNSGGSGTTNMITPAARNAAYQDAQQLPKQLSSVLGADDLNLVDGKIVSKSDPSKSMAFKAACRKLTTETIAARGDRTNDYPLAHRPAAGKGAGGVGGVQFAQVAVDT